MATRTEAYYENTLLGRLEVRWILFRVKWRYEKPEAFWQWLAWKLPRSLVCWALVRTACHAMDRNPDDPPRVAGAVGPDELTYPVLFNRWTEEPRDG